MKMSYGFAVLFLFVFGYFCLEVWHIWITKEHSANPPLLVILFFLSIYDFIRFAQCRKAEAEKEKKENTTAHQK